MEKHYGQILERTVRRNNFSLSELARITHVNRRSLYNWFNMPRIKPEIIFRIGCAMRYDFSIDFPELFTSDDFQKAFAKNIPNGSGEIVEEKANYWKDKYIDLLEEYNKVLLGKVADEKKRLRSVDH